MKKILCIVGVFVAIILVGLVGCKKSEIDTSQVQSAFQNASPDIKTNIDTLVSQVKANNYPGALATLQTSLTSAKLTPEQKSALQNLGDQIKGKVTGSAQKAMGEATNAGANAAKSAQDLFKK